MKKTERKFNHLLHLMKISCSADDCEAYYKMILGWVDCQFVLCEITSDQETEFVSRLDEAMEEIRTNQLPFT
jgi:hypothetical protein